MPNFPEDISENIVRQYILQKEKCKCIWNTKVGDLLKPDNKMLFKFRSYIIWTKGIVG